MTCVVAIGGSDSSGGAGIQADLTTFHELRIQGASVITCVTAQNMRAVKQVHRLPLDVTAAQIDAVFEAFFIQAVKIGMLYDAKTIRKVSEKLKQWRPPFIVLDPVMISTSGYRLLEEEAVAALKEELFPCATLVTPNLREAEVLLNRPVGDFSEDGKRLLELGSQAVLIKGGHSHKKGWDCLTMQTEESLWLRQETISTNEVKGTGCRLSSSIAAFLAKGFSLKDAVFHGKSYVHRYISG